MWCANRCAISEPGDDRGENKSTGVNRVQHRQCAAAFERGYEKHHYRDVANYPSEKAPVDNVTGERAVCFFRAGFVEKLTKRTEKGSDDEEDYGERRRSHKVMRA